MNIAILTLPIYVNYGGILQGYALQTILEKQGHNVLFLNLRYKPQPIIIRSLVFCKHFIYSLLFKKKYLSKKDWLYASRELTRFRLQYMKLSKSLYTNDELYKEYKKNKFDVIIYGSDQIWSSSYAPQLDCYFGSFLGHSDKVKQVAYAASFGTSNGVDYGIDKMKVYSGLLKKFTNISVRENSGIDICQKCFGLDAKLVLDPTLLLDINEYRKLVNNACTFPSAGNLHVYILDESDEKKSIVSQVAKENSLIPFFSNKNVHDISVPIEQRSLYSLEQWIKSFDDASFVVTDSFHGCIFSILFKKPFIAIANKQRGLERFLSLLSLFNLNDRLIFSYDEFKMRKSELLHPINYDEVFNKLSQLRKESILYLNESLYL